MRAILQAIAVIAGVTLAPAGAEAGGAGLDLTPFVAREITPKIHVLTTPGDFYGYAISNIVLIEQSDGFVVIDSGITASNGRTVVAYSKSLSTKPIKAVAITHWHNDHPQGVSAIRDAYPRVRIITTPATEQGMLGPEAFNIGYAPDARADAAVAKRVEGNKSDLRKLLDDPATDAARRGRIARALVQLDAYARDFPGTYIVLPTETLDRRLILSDRDIPVELRFLGRANTAGDLVAYLPRQRVVAAGDIVVSPIPFGFGSYPADWIKTLRKLQALGFRTLIPGHGEPQTDGVYLSKLVQAITDIRKQVGPLARNGATLEGIRNRIELQETASLFGSSDRDRAGFKSLFSDPMIENAYKEANGMPIIQGQGIPAPEFTQAPPPPRSFHHKG